MNPIFLDRLLHPLADSASLMSRALLHFLGIGLTAAGQLSVIRYKTDDLRMIDIGLASVHPGTAMTGWPISPARAERLIKLCITTGHKVSGHLTTKNAYLIGATISELKAAFEAGPSGFQLNRTIIEAVPHGWWYAARLPWGAVLAGFHTTHPHARCFSALIQDAGCARSRTRSTFRPCFEESGSKASFGHSTRPAPVLISTVEMDGSPAVMRRFRSIRSPAKYSGMTAAHAIEDALNGLNESLNEYSRRLEQVRRIYVARSRALYRSQFRWKNEPFWSTLGAERLDVSKVSVRQSVLKC